MIKTIRVRRSKRTYDEIPLEEKHIQLIKDAVYDYFTPYHHSSVYNYVGFNSILNICGY